MSEFRGTSVASGTYDRTAWIWDATSGEQLRILNHGDQVTAVTFSPNSRWRLATASSDRTARIWDTTTGEQLHMFAHDDQVWAAAFSPDDRWLATGISGNRAVLWALTAPSP